MTKITPLKDKKKALVTGSSGFIGYHLCQRLLLDGWRVLGLDGMTDYYDISLKKNRNSILEKNKNFTFVYTKLEKKHALKAAFKDFNPSIVVHLAAQAGVRYSITHPETYVDSNILGTFNLLEILKEEKCSHFLMASTSQCMAEIPKLHLQKKMRLTFQCPFIQRQKSSRILVIITLTCLESQQLVSGSLPFMGLGEDRYGFLNSPKVS